MLPFVIIYAIIISFMLAKSISLKNAKSISFISHRLIILGTIMFYVSDFILMFVIFHSNPSRFLSPLNLLVYYIGQASIAISFAF